MATPHTRNDVVHPIDSISEESILDDSPDEVEVVGGVSQSIVVAVRDDGTCPSWSSSFPQEDSFCLPVEEEAPPGSSLENEFVSLLGRIEILLVEERDESGEIYRRRLQVICLPGDSARVSCLFRNRDVSADDASAADDQSSDSSVFEQIANTLMDSCAGPCAPVFPKSALRKGGSDRNVYRSVKFDKIDIHEFAMTLGHHPSSVSGPPMALDWDHEARVSTLPLDEYERSRMPRRDRRQLKIPMKTRCGILQKEANISAMEITRAWEEALLVRKQRRETLQGGISQMAYDEFWESANRKFKRVTDSISSMLLL